MKERKFYINSDLGEHGIEGIKKHDKHILAYIDACNIAAGGHAGDNETISMMIRLAQKQGVKIGIHPSYPDRENFGRKEIDISKNKLYKSLKHQIKNFLNLADLAESEVHHIKAHGALYNRLAHDFDLAAMYCDLILETKPQLVVYGLAQSHFIDFAKAKGLKVHSEAFMDRLYTTKLQLTPRSLPNAVHSKVQAANQYRQLQSHGSVVCVDGITRVIDFDTLCIHGDGDGVLEVLRLINSDK